MRPTMNGEERLVEMISWKEMQKRAVLTPSSKPGLSSKVVSVSIVEVKKVHHSDSAVARSKSNVAEWLHLQDP